MRLISIAAFASLLAVPGYATNPPAGIYTASIYVENVEGGGCIDPLGRLSTGTLNYYGLSGRKAGFRVPIAGFSAASSSTQVLTITSGSGTTKPQGTFTWVAKGMGINWNVSGHFSATIIPVDGYSFAMQMVETYGTCTEHLNTAMTKIGPTL
jgi:hypothetical protein